jgi:two-component system, NarL family, sensor kinase
MKEDLALEMEVLQRSDMEIFQLKIKDVTYATIYIFNILMVVINYCKFLFCSLIIIFINGISYSNPIEGKQFYDDSYLIINLFKQTNKENFKQLESEINEKIKKQQYKEALDYSIKMKEAAIKANSEYWLCVSNYYYGINKKYLKDYNTSIHYFSQIIKQGNSSFYKEKSRLFKLFLQTAEVYKKLNSFPEATTYYKKCLEIKDELNDNDKQGLIAAYVNLGSIYSSQSKFPEAKECYFNGLNLVPNKNDYSASIIYNNLGNDEYSQGNYSKAIEYYMNSVQISEKLEDLERLALTYNNIGNIYTNELKDFKKANEYYIKSLEIEKKRKNNEGIADELNNIGNVFTFQLNFSEAEKKFKDALLIFTEIGNSEGMARTYEFFGALYNRAGKYNKAISAFSRCIDIRKNDNNEIKLTNVYNNLGAIYYYKKEYNQALQLYFKALDLAKLKNDKSMINRVLCGIHEAYAASGQYDKAYKYLQDYSNLKDTLLNATISRQIIDIQEKYEKSKMEQKVTMQNLEIKNKSLQRNGILAFLVLSIIVFTGALFIIFQKRKNEKTLYEKNSKIKDQEIQNLVQRSEIATMVSKSEGQEQERQRISRELHDRVGSMLSLLKLNLSSFENDNNQLIKENLALLDNTYQEVRNISHNLHSGLLTHFGLKAALNDLKNTIEAHSSMRFNLLFHEGEQVMPKETESVIFKVLQELVTNALKHSDAKNLDIQVNYAEGNEIIITVEDDGKGFDTSSVKEGIGIKNAKYRIESIGGNIEINASPGRGACFLLNIPVTTSTDKKLIS